jgi:UDP-GlcNAc:undecaprenyl-phosphate/decaprenyl-phosphate GlcNAc-1-phosphate transferase
MEILWAFAVSWLLTYAATPIVISIARRFNLVDDPKRRYHPAHVHSGVIPRAGGLALGIGIIIPMILFLGFTKITLGILVASTLLLVVGILDDRRDVNPYVRFVTNTAAALIIVGSGIGIPYITNPLGGVIRLDAWRVVFDFFGPHSVIIWSDIFALLWILWTINIVGWSAGVDGQMPGFVAIAAAILGILSFRFSQTGNFASVSILAFIISGAFAGFIPWNFFPQKIMPGYGGKTLAGLLLAVLAILSYGKVGTALLVLGIPTFDALFTLVRRVRKGKSPVWADRGHLHHRLLDMGWGKRRIAVFYWAVSGFLGYVALSVTSQQKLFILLLVAVAFGGFILWIKFFTQLSRPPDPDNG